jgi:hypothetical protein
MSNYIKVLPAVSTPIGATLMKTGQTTSYRTGDDGDLERGRATDFFTLPSNNPFGNTNRFTSELGTQTYTNNIVIDWSTYNGTTVLGWDRRVNGGNAITTKTWNQAMDEALAHSNSGFATGWSLPNYMEIASIMNLETPSINYTPFNIGGSRFWTSSTLKLATTAAYELNGNDCQLRYSLKTLTFNWLACRKFTVTGTTLT